MKREINMYEGPLLPSIIRYTVPIILTSLLQLFFNAADLIVVGQFCGSIYVAAVGATGSLTNLIVNLFIGLSIGAGVAVAQAIGAKNDDEVHRTVHTAIPAAAVSGLIMTVIGLWLAPDFLRWMDTPDSVLALSSLYMRLYFCGMTASMLYNYGAALLRAAGDTKSPLFYLTVAGVLNIFLNVLFVVAFKMHVAGVALATAISQTVSAALVLWALHKRTDACRLELKKLKFHKKPLLKMMRIGMPAGIQGSLFSISNVLIQSSINSFGEVVMSGNAAASNLEGFVYVAINAFSQTSLNFTGQNIGACRYDRIPKILHTCLLCATVVGLALGTVAYLLGRPLLGIYITDSPEAITYGMSRLAYICLPYFLCGVMDVTTGSVRGMGFSLAPMIATVLGVCVFRIVWIYTVFAIFRTPENLYVSYPISWALTFVVEYWMFHHYMRRVRQRASTVSAEAEMAHG